MMDKNDGVIVDCDNSVSVMDVAEKCTTNESIEILENALLEAGQITIPVSHIFSDGIYVRSIYPKKKSFIIGHKHKKANLNILVKGTMTLYMDGKKQKISAPFIVNSQADVRKMAYCNTDCIWLSVHATNEKDIDVLEDDLIEKSNSFRRHENAANEKVLTLNQSINKKPE